MHPKLIYLIYKIYLLTEYFEEWLIGPGLISLNTYLNECMQIKCWESLWAHPPLQHVSL